MRFPRTGPRNGSRNGSRNVTVSRHSTNDSFDRIGVSVEVRPTECMPGIPCTGVRGEVYPG